MSQVLTKCSIPAENFPFCTIDPNNVRRPRPPALPQLSAANPHAAPPHRLRSPAPRPHTRPQARVNIPDERFNWLVDLYKPKSQIPAFLEARRRHTGPPAPRAAPPAHRMRRDVSRAQVVDIAGLVKGAAEGQGLGNAFLSHSRAVDGIFHVVRAFDDEAVIHGARPPPPAPCTATCCRNNPRCVRRSG